MLLATNLCGKPSAGLGVLDGVVPGGDGAVVDLLLKTPESRLQAFFNPLCSFVSFGAVSILCAVLKQRGEDQSIDRTCDRERLP